jgi:hypothetical protein
LTNETISTGMVLAFHGQVGPKWRLTAALAGNWVEIEERQQKLFQQMCMNVMTSLVEVGWIPTSGRPT